MKIVGWKSVIFKLWVLSQVKYFLTTFNANQAQSHLVKHFGWKSIAPIASLKLDIIPLIDGNITGSDINIVSAKLRMTDFQPNDVVSQIMTSLKNEKSLFSSNSNTSHN